MKIKLKERYIQQLYCKEDNLGFTLVELLVVIIIIGILAAISLPNFLSQSAKAKQTEAKQNVGLTNRVQTAYRTENNTFATSFDTLATGTLSGSTQYTTKTYIYDLSGAQDSTSITAKSTIDTALKVYSGATIRFRNTQNQSTISSVLCEAPIPGTGAATAPSLNISATTTSSAIFCPSIYNQL
jgi:type IV pilus assembly protein PilA